MSGSKRTPSSLQLVPRINASHTPGTSTQRILLRLLIIGVLVCSGVGVLRVPSGWAFQTSRIERPEDGLVLFTVSSVDGVTSDLGAGDLPLATVVREPRFLDKRHGHDEYAVSDAIASDDRGRPCWEARAPPQMGRSGATG